MSKNLFESFSNAVIKAKNNHRTTGSIFGKSFEIDGEAVYFGGYVFNICELL